MNVWGGSCGLVVMGDDACSRGHEFESQRSALVGHDIFHIDLFLKSYCLFEKTKNEWKRCRGRPGPFLEKDECYTEILKAFSYKVW